MYLECRSLSLSCFYSPFSWLMLRSVESSETWCWSQITHKVPTKIYRGKSKFSLCCRGFSRSSRVSRVSGVFEKSTNNQLTASCGARRVFKYKFVAVEYKYKDTSTPSVFKAWYTVQCGVNAWYTILSGTRKFDLVHQLKCLVQAITTSKKNYSSRQ